MERGEDTKEPAAAEVEAKEADRAAVEAKEAAAREEAAKEAAAREEAAKEGEAAEAKEADRSAAEASEREVAEAESLKVEDPDVLFEERSVAAGEKAAEERAVPVDATAGEDVIDDDRRGEAVAGEDLDLGAETGTDVREGTGGATAGDASPLDVTTAEELERERVDVAGDLGADVADLGLEQEGGRLERELDGNAGDFFGGPGEIATGPEHGLEGANSADYSAFPNLQANLKTYQKAATKAAAEGNVDAAYAIANAATKEINHVNEHGTDVKLVGENAGGWGYEVRVDAEEGVQQAEDHEMGDVNPYRPGTPAYEQFRQMNNDQEGLFAPKPPGASQPIDQNEELPPWMHDPSEGWGSEDDDVAWDVATGGGVTDPGDQVDSTTGGIAPTEAPTDMFEQYEEGYVPPDELTGNEIPDDGHLDPLINPE